MTPAQQAANIDRQRQIGLAFLVPPAFKAIGVCANGVLSLTRGPAIGAYTTYNSATATTYSAYTTAATATGQFVTNQSINVYVVTTTASASAANYAYQYGMTAYYSSPMWAPTVIEGVVFAGGATEGSPPSCGNVKQCASTAISNSPFAIPAR